MQGFINVYKPSNMSSAKVVAKIKHKFKLSKVGHMGTLDPLACGILPIAIGKATRMFDYFLNKTKSYVSVFKFGCTSSTLDLGSEIVETNNFVPKLNEIENVLNKFIGNIKQVPPNFSANSVEGIKAYKLARANVDFELKEKDISIADIIILEQVDESSFKFLITCSSGTYIRSLARDIAKELGTIALVTYIERVSSDNFNVNNCVKLDDLLNGNINDYLIEIEEVFNKIKIINVNCEDFNKLKNGISIKLKVINGIYFIKYNNVLLGVAESFDNTLKLKTYLLN